MSSKAGVRIVIARPGRKHERVAELTLASAILRIQELADYIFPLGLRLASELRLAEQLHGGPQSGRALADAVGADPDALHRLLRALAARGVFAELEPGSWTLTPAAAQLVGREELRLQPDAVRAWGRFALALRAAAGLPTGNGGGRLAAADGPPAAPAAESFDERDELALPFLVRAVCDLGVADHVREGPVPADALAARLGVNRGALARTLAALADRGIFTAPGAPPATFALSPLAELLRSDHPLSLRGAYPLLPANFDAWARFKHSVRTGLPAFELVHGLPYYDHLAHAPHDAARFNAIQRAGNRLEVRTMGRVWDWRQVRTVVDVGGADGAFVAALLARNRQLRGFVVDLPHALCDSDERFERAGCGDRAQAVPASFFDDVPAGADVYVLKRVLYDWDDQRARAVLEQVRRAMRSDSRLLVLDPVIVPGNDFDPAKLYDLLSLTMLGGRARSEPEMRALLASAGLAVNEVVPTPMLPVVDAKVA
ncbi:MAG: methyltransferase [Solirubrobacteraceae bacterium]